jgi:hypothetical protein
LGEIGTNKPHVLGTTKPPSTTGPVGGAGPAPWRDPIPKHRLFLEQNLDEQDSLRKHWYDQMVEARITGINGSTYAATQPPQPSFRGDPRHP